MGFFSDIKVVPKHKGAPIPCQIFVNDEEISNVTKIEYVADTDSVPRVILELNASGLQAPAQALLSYTPETLQEATKIILNEYLTNTYFKAAVISSINSALNERWMGGNSRDSLANRIADRVFGLE